MNSTTPMMLVDHRHLQVRVAEWQRLFNSPCGFADWLYRVADNREAWSWCGQLGEDVEIEHYSVHLTGPVPELPTYSDIADEDSGQLGEYLDRMNPKAVEMLSNPASSIKEIRSIANAYGIAFNKKARTEMLTSRDVEKTLGVSASEAQAYLDAVHMSGWFSDPTLDGSLGGRARLIVPTIPLSYVSAHCQGKDEFVSAWCEQARTYLVEQQSAHAAIVNASTVEQRKQVFKALPLPIRSEILREKYSPLRKSFLRADDVIRYDFLRRRGTAQAVADDDKRIAKERTSGVGQQLATFLNKQSVDKQ